MYKRQDLVGVPLVGDSLRDVQLAMVVGANPVLVRTGHGTQTLEQNRHLDKVQVFDDLAGFAEICWVSIGTKILRLGERCAVAQQSCRRTKRRRARAGLLSACGCYQLRRGPTLQ